MAWNANLANKVLNKKGPKREWGPEDEEAATQARAKGQAREWGPSIVGKRTAGAAYRYKKTQVATSTAQNDLRERKLGRES
jgi:hypothetical protein